MAFKQGENVMTHFPSLLMVIILDGSDIFDYGWKVEGVESLALPTN